MGRACNLRASRPPPHTHTRTPRHPSPHPACPIPSALSSSPAAPTWSPSRPLVSTCSSSSARVSACFGVCVCGGGGGGECRVLSSCGSSIHTHATPHTHAPHAHTHARSPCTHTCTRAGVVSGLRQLLEFGLFHGDPHPGNIFALRDGRIAYVDFGNVATLRCVCVCVWGGGALVGGVQRRLVIGPGDPQPPALPPPSRSPPPPSLAASATRRS